MNSTLFPSIELSIVAAGLAVLHIVRSGSLSQAAILRVLTCSLGVLAFSLSGYVLIFLEQSSSPHMAAIPWIFIAAPLGLLVGELMFSFYSHKAATPPRPGLKWKIALLSGVAIYTMDHMLGQSWALFAWTASIAGIIVFVFSQLSYHQHKKLLIVMGLSFIAFFFAFISTFLDILNGDSNTVPVVSFAIGLALVLRWDSYLVIYLNSKNPNTQI